MFDVTGFEPSFSQLQPQRSNMKLYRDIPLTIIHLLRLASLFPLKEPWNRPGQFSCEAEITSARKSDPKVFFIQYCLFWKHS